MKSTNHIGALKAVRYLLLFSIITAGLVSIIATGGGGGGGTSSTGTGTLSIGLTDQTTDKYQAIYVTIKEIQVHMPGGGRETVGEPNETYNLLELVNGVIEQLGVRDLPAGDYTQMRLILGDTPDNGKNILGDDHPFANYLIDQLDDAYALKCPSCPQTGIKLVRGFTINDGGITELVLDFDALKSVVDASNQKRKKYLLKPTIKVIDMIVSSTISGIVTDDGDAPVEGAIVSAQIYDDQALDTKDEVIVQASTITSESGAYTLILEAGTYNVVAYMDDYSPACTNIVLEFGTDVTDTDFQLETLGNPTDTGTVSGKIIIENAKDGDSAIISFRQTADCDGDTTVEVKSLNLDDGVSFSGVILPVGTYSVVASAEGRVTWKDDFEIFGDSDTPFGDIELQLP